MRVSFTWFLFLGTFLFMCLVSTHTHTRAVHLFLEKGSKHKKEAANIQS